MANIRGGSSGRQTLAPSRSTVYVSNLPFSLTNTDLHKIFEKFGKLVRVTVHRDKYTRKSRGVAFMLYLSRDEAQACVKGTDGCEMFGRTLKASMAKDNGRAPEFIRRREYLDKSRCYECGEAGHLSYSCPKNLLGEREPPKKKSKKIKKLACLYLLFVVCGVAAMPARGSCISPVDLKLGSSMGAATTHLPVWARKLTVPVVLESSEREGVVVARLVPVDVDAPRCINSSSSDLPVFCYKYSEIRWSNLATHGSDHAVNGQKSDLEIQHYLRRTHGEMTRTPLAVGVLASVVGNDRLRNTTYQRSVAEIMKLIKNETRKIDFTLGNLLPPDGQPYYQYNGTVPGSCSEETEWLVYNGEMDTSIDLLEALKGRWSREAHFDIVDASPKIFYSRHGVDRGVISLRAPLNDSSSAFPANTTIPSSAFPASDNTTTPSSELPASTNTTTAATTPSSELPVSTNTTTAATTPSSELPASTNTTAAMTPSSELPASTNTTAATTPSSELPASTNTTAATTPNSALPASTNTTTTPSSVLPASTSTTTTPSSVLPASTSTTTTPSSVLPASTNSTAMTHSSALPFSAATAPSSALSASLTTATSSEPNPSTQTLTPSSKNELVEPEGGAANATNIPTTITPLNTLVLVTSVNSTLEMPSTSIATLDRSKSLQSSVIKNQNITTLAIIPTSTTPENLNKSTSYNGLIYEKPNSGQINTEPNGDSAARGVVSLGFLSRAAMISIAVVIVSLILFILF